ncbi:MAG TPA: hypothetical protein VK137_03225, partial [Planctomycetaceae bacterium]|nr:hypothetical protein [Planctomycetaceae bacterium]
AKLTNDDLREIGRLSNLEALMLVETLATDAGLEHLSGLAQLKFLRLEGSLSGQEFSDQGLKSLTSLSSLAELILYGTGFTDDGASVLASLRSLKTLHLADTAITRAGQMKLRGQLSKDTQVFDQLMPRPGPQ